MRICKKCNIEKDIGCFVKKKHKKGMCIMHTCLDCMKLYNQNYHSKYYVEHGDVARERGRGKLIILFLNLNCLIRI